MNIRPNNVIFARKTDHRTYFKSSSKNSIMAGYGRTLGREYAKKCLIFSEVCYSEKVSGQTFDSYNFSIECSI